MEETSSTWRRWGRGIFLHLGGADSGSAHTRQQTTLRFLIRGIGSLRATFTIKNLRWIDQEV